MYVVQIASIIFLSRVGESTFYRDSISAIKYVGLKRKTKIHISQQPTPARRGITRQGGIVGRTLQTFAGINGHLHARSVRWLSADSFRYTLWYEAASSPLPPTIPSAQLALPLHSISGH